MVLFRNGVTWSYPFMENIPYISLLAFPLSWISTIPTFIHNFNRSEDSLSFYYSNAFTLLFSLEVTFNEKYVLCSPRFVLVHALDRLYQLPFIFYFEYLTYSKAQSTLVNFSKLLLANCKLILVWRSFSCLATQPNFDKEAWKTA